MALNSPVVTLRAWTRSDYRRCRHWPAAPVPQHWLTPLHPASGEPQTSIAICADNSLVGRINLRPCREWFGHSSARLGIYLRPGWYGHGIGQQALRQLPAYAGVETLRLDVAADNQLAIRCYRRVGFGALYIVWADEATYIEMMWEAYASDRCLPRRALFGVAD